MENAEELEKLLQYKDDEKVLEKLREIKGNAKKELKNYLKMTQNVDIDENAIFDIQMCIRDRIGRVFRNEGLDTRHNPEFTLDVYKRQAVV